MTTKSPAQRAPAMAEAAPLVAVPLADAVGGKAAKALAGLGITSVDDLLAYIPRRYAQRGELTDLASLQPGEQVTIVGRIAAAKSRRLESRSSGPRRREILEVEVTDGTGRLTLTFFNQGWRAKDLVVGRVGLFAGEVGSFRGNRQLLHPDYQILGLGEDAARDAQAFANAIIAIYPASAKLPSWQISQCVDLVLPLCQGITDPLDEQLRSAANVIGLSQALQWVHRPQSMAQVQQGRHRLRWDEALTLQVLLAQRRAALAADPAVARPGRPGGLAERFDAALPFQLTGGQAQVGQELAGELAGNHPMHRLLQGEVGSGKTVVALRAMLQVVDSQGQCALLAPTEVLAAQHARSLAALLGDLGRGGQLGSTNDATSVVLLTGSMGVKARRAALTLVASGVAGIVVGTHALLEDVVQFADLGLVVVDEQHRFGVEQRAALAAKSADGTRPHVLVMTATPIPRTVAMTVFGDLEVSTLRELPAGRSPIVTHVVAAAQHPAHYERVWARAREEVAAGRQVYVVCPRIDADEAESDDAPPGEPSPANAGPPAAAVSVMLPRLAENELAGLRVGGLTGRMSGADKDQAMTRFANPDQPDGLDVLVATTVIEVGVDVPNATLMVVLDADRFGVSQLHQLRGRVGRGGHPGLCLLVTTAPVGSPARERLDAVAATSDGFALSQFDLRVRHEGDILGAAQSGSRRTLKLLSVLDDEDLILAARSVATALVGRDPTLGEHPGLAAALARSFDAERTEFLDKS